METRRKFMQNSLLGALALSYNSYGEEKVPKEKDNENSPNDPEWKNPHVTIEIVPAGKTYTEAQLQKIPRIKNLLIQVTDMQYSKDLQKINGLEGMLMEGGSDKLMKDDKKEIEKRKDQIIKFYGKNMTTLIRITNTNLFLPLPGFHITEDLILTPYDTIKETLEGINTTYHATFEEKKATLSNTEIIAYSPSANLALLKTPHPRKHVHSPKISSSNPFQGERLFGLYRDFTTKDTDQLLTAGGTVKPNELIPISTNYKGLNFNFNNEKPSIELIGNIQHSFCLGYATRAIKDTENLIVNQNNNNFIKEMNAQNIRKNIANVIPTIIRRDTGLLGSPIFDSGGDLCTFTALAADMGNISYSISPLIIRGFLTAYQEEASKKKIK